MKNLMRLFLICLSISLFVNRHGFSQNLSGYTPSSLINTKMGIAPGDLGVKVIEGEVITPQKMVVDNNGNIYILDTANNRIEIFDNSGNYKKSINVDSFSLDKKQKGDILPKMHRADRDISVDAKGNLYVYNGEKRNIRKISSTGTFINEYQIPDTKEIENTHIDSKYGPSYYDINIKIDDEDNLVVILNTKNSGQKKYAFNSNDNICEYNKEGEFIKNIKIQSIDKVYQTEFVRVDVANNAYLYVVTKKDDEYKWYLYVYDSNGQEKNKIELSYPVNFIDNMGNLYSFIQHGDPYIDEKNIKFEVIKWERKEK